MKILNLAIMALLLCPAASLADMSSTSPDAQERSSVAAATAPVQVAAGTNESGQDQSGLIPSDNGIKEKNPGEQASVEENYIPDEAEEAGMQISDPFAPTNRVMYTVNDKLYFWLLKPVTQVYSHVPEDFRIVFSNIYDNLWAPSRILNNLFQLRLRGAGNELTRFVINSTVGVGGMGDAARDAFGIKKQEADFGQTLGWYGFGHGFYLVLPFFGPSSLRDGVGLAGDQLMHPLSYVGSSHLTFGQQTGISAHEKVNSTSFRIGDYESFKESAVDPYISMRDAFVQYRKKKVEESKQ